MYQNHYQDQNYGQYYQQQQQQFTWDPSNGGYHYTDPNITPYQQAWQDPDQPQIYPPQPQPPPPPPHPDAYSHHQNNVPTIQTQGWDDPSPSGHPGQYQHLQPIIGSREQPPAPPAYDPAQRPLSWPSSPQDYQNYYTAAFPVPGPSTLQPPPQPPPPKWLGHHSHSHHQSISGPLGLPNIPGTTQHFTQFPRAADLALEDAQRIRDSFGVGGLHHTPVINIIANRSPEHLEDVLISYRDLTSHDLLATLKDTSRSNKLNQLIDNNSKHFNTAARAILLGPVKSEGYWVIKAVKGSGTNEALLTESIFGRTNPELEMMKSYVRASHFKFMEEYVRSDLSMTTRDLFDLGMEESPSKDPNQMRLQPDPTKTKQDVQRIISSTPTISLFSRNPTILCQILAQRTPICIVAIADEYRFETGKNLRDLISRVFFGHMKDALLYILDGAVDKVERDARLLEDAMVGAGTRNHLLISRLIRIHWNKKHLAEVKRRYRELYKQDLENRIRKEVRGSYRDLMIAIVESDTSPWRQ